MKKIFFVEVTDTDGGEAKYSWVHSFKVHASTARGAMRKVERRLPYLGGVRKYWDTGVVECWAWRKACVCAFGECYTDQAESLLHGVESL